MQDYIAGHWPSMLAQHDKSTQSADRSRLKQHLLPALGDVMLKDINAQRLQTFIARFKGKAKSVKNVIALLRIMWTSAKAWGYVKHDPFDGLVLPKVDQAEQPMWSIEVQSLIASTSNEYGLAFWLDFETGIRRGGLCALDVRYVDLENSVITVRYSCTGKFIKPTKSRRPRVFSLSPQLTEALRVYTQGRNADEPLFLSSEGKATAAGQRVQARPQTTARQAGVEGWVPRHEAWQRHSARSTQCTAEGPAGSSWSRRLGIHDGIHASGFSR